MLLLIVGITGNLGQRLANVAASRGLSVRGLGRDRAKLRPETSALLESFVVSQSYYDIPAIEEALQGVDSVICAYATDPILYLDGALILLRAAERARVKTFVAPSWTSNWTNLRYGDFTIYDSIIAFADQASLTSSIKPVYIINGSFAEYLLAGGTGSFEENDRTAKAYYWDNMHKTKIPWTAMNDAAAWTIELLLTGDSIREGRGGIFQFQSGYNSLEELASIYEQERGVPVELIRKGDLAELERVLITMESDDGRKRISEHTFLAWSRLGLRGYWDLERPIQLHHAKQPTTFAEHLRAR